ncbi:MAG: recombinase family protein [Roseobacter sp.]
MEILDKLSAKGAALRILGMGIDTATPTGKLMLTVLVGITEFEREITFARQRKGIAQAKSASPFKGSAGTTSCGLSRH